MPSAIPSALVGMVAREKVRIVESFSRPVAAGRRSSVKELSQDGPPRTRSRLVRARKASERTERFATRRGADAKLACRANGPRLVGRKPCRPVSAQVFGVAQDGAR